MSSGNKLFAQNRSLHNLEMLPGSRSSSWISEGGAQPIPWNGSGSDVGSTSTARPPSVMLWRANGSARHLSSTSFGSNEQRSIPVNSVAMYAGPSRSRVSMDALPCDEDDEDDRESHHTFASSSSTASLPVMYEDALPPAPQGRSSAIPPRPVGLGLSAVAGGQRRDWPPARDLADDIESDEEEDHETNEIESYMASHRAPVDATLRSMPGVVGLGDGWASMPQNKPSRRWFKRDKKVEPPTEQDPLALWTVPESPKTTLKQPAATQPPPRVGESTAADPNAKWWKSRKSLFSASQRVLPSSPQNVDSSSPSPSKPPAAGKRRESLGRSRLNFGSMVNLGRNNNKAKEREALTSSNISAAMEAPKPAPPKRHSVAGFLRKPAPHPLELSHGSNGSTASQSQPTVFAASSSQPSFLISPSPNHPLLRQSFARSESHLAGSHVRVTMQNMPRPAPLITSPTTHTTQYATPPGSAWRPPVMSPTPLVEVEEEDEEEEGTPESTERPVLKRSATFGDEEELQDHGIAQTPALSDITASPQEPHRALATPSSTHRSIAATAPSINTANAPSSSLLGRIKAALTGGRKNKVASVAYPSPIPASPRSVQSEQYHPRTPTRSSSVPMPTSVGRQLRPKSRIFGRREMSKLAVDMDEEREASPASKGSYRVSKHVVESMINLSTRRESFPETELSAPSNASGSRSRTSWAPSTLALREDDVDDRIRSKVTLRRFSKSSGKQRPALGTVFPRPPTHMQQPPSLHWALPGSYSTPMLHKFGGSTLSLALDISADGIDDGLENIAESPPTTELDQESRERALASTIAALSGHSTAGKGDARMRETERALARQSVGVRRLSLRRPPPVERDDNTGSTDSLAMANCLGDFPLPPSASSCEASSPDQDQVEQLCTPREMRQYPSPSVDYYASPTPEAGRSSNESDDGRRIRKAPSWSTCKTSSAATSTSLATLASLATPTSETSPAGEQARIASSRQRDSFGSLLTDSSEGHGHHHGQLSHVSGLTHATRPYVNKRDTIIAPVQQPIVV